MSRKKILILILLSFLASRRLWRPGYFSMQDDIQIFRLSQFDQCVKDGQIPCRYIPDGGLGYGYPLFNYYSPLPYAFAQSFHLLGLSLINSIKIVFISSFFIASLGMFYLSKLLFNKKSALISATIFLFSPYLAIDSFVRGAIAELLALSLLPWVFYTAIKQNQKPNKRNLLLATLSLTSLFLSHNLYSLVGLGLLISYLTLFHRQKIKNNLLSIGFALGTSSFFLLPAILEKNLVTVETMTQGYFNFVNHFVDLKQLFISRFWGYGASLWGPVDDMSFQLGWIQWGIPAIVLLLTITKQIKTKQKTILFFSFSALAFIFLTHSRSTFIWKSIPFMAYFQFPWRFLGFAVFCLSIISGHITKALKKPISQNLTIAILIVLTVGLNINYFKEDIWFPNLTDAQKLSQPELIRQSGAGLKDYWPKIGDNFPNQFSHNQIRSDYPITTQNFVKKSNRLIVDIDNQHESNTATLPLVYFPNWKLYLNGSRSDYSIDPDLGLIKIKLATGPNHIELNFVNSTIRNIANLISLFTTILLALYLVKAKNEK